MVISNILYTDMKRHFESLNAFEVKQKEFMEQPDSLCNFSFLNNYKFNVFHSYSLKLI